MANWVSDVEVVRKIYEEYVRDSGLNRANLLEEALDRIEAELAKLREENESLERRLGWVQRDLTRARTHAEAERDRLREDHETGLYHGPEECPADRLREALKRIANLPHYNLGSEPLDTAAIAPAIARQALEGSE